MSTSHEQLSNYGKIMAQQRWGDMYSYADKLLVSILRGNPDIFETDGANPNQAPRTAQFVASIAKDEFAQQILAQQARAMTEAPAKMPAAIMPAMAPALSTENLATETTNSASQVKAKPAPAAPMQAPIMPASQPIATPTARTLTNEERLIQQVDAAYDERGITSAQLPAEAPVAAPFEQPLAANAAPINLETPAEGTIDVGADQRDRLNALRRQIDAIHNGFDPGTSMAAQAAAVMQNGGEQI